jgi:electron transfer flavoprotein beta subunit
MNIIVCIKQVPDPEGPQDCFVINPETLRVEPRGIPPVLSLFDENGLEAALRIKDALQDQEVKITAVSVGKKISNAVLQKALAVGADELVKVEDAAFDSGALDSHAAASVLASTIKKIGNYDLILAGRQAADWNAGQVGIGIAHLLGIPAVTLARKVEIEDVHSVVERVTPAGYEVVKTPLPSLIVASNEVGEMRYPTMIQRREAKKKPVASWGASDLGLEGTLPNRLVLKRLFAPEMREGQCHLIVGETPAEAGRKLAQRLRNDGVL